MDVYVRAARRARARVEETAIVKNVLASASVVCAHTATVCMYPRTHNRPYCLAIVFQPSTVYGLARLLVLRHTACLSVVLRGRAYSRARERTMHDHVMSRVGAQQARKEEARG